MTAGAAAVIWRGPTRPGRGGSGGGDRAARRSAHAETHPGHLDVAEGAHDLDLEVREGGDDLPFAAAAGAHAFDAESSKAVHDLDLDVGKGVDDLDLAAQRMPCVQLALSIAACARAGAASGRGRGGSAFFSWGRDGSARPSALQAQPARQLCRLLGSTSSTRAAAAQLPSCLQRGAASRQRARRISVLFGAGMVARGPGPSSPAGAPVVQVAGVHLQHARGRGPVAVQCLQRASRTLARQASTASRKVASYAVRRRWCASGAAARDGRRTGPAGFQRDDVVVVGARLTA